MKRAWSAIVAACGRIPSWSVRLLFVALYAWLAVSCWADAKYGWFGFVMFCAGEAWSRIFSDIRFARQERLRAMWEDLARKAIDRCNQQHEVFIEMGPPLDVLREHFTKPRKSECN